MHCHQAPAVYRKVPLYRDWTQIPIPGFLKIKYRYFSGFFYSMCVLKFPAREGAKSHWLHLFGFSPQCLLRWFLKLLAILLAAFFYFSPSSLKFAPSPPSLECCPLHTVSFKLRKLELQIKRENQWKWESLLKPNYIIIIINNWNMLWKRPGFTCQIWSHK